MPRFRITYDENLFLKVKIIHYYMYIDNIFFNKLSVKVGGYISDCMFQMVNLISCDYLEVKYCTVTNKHGIT
jgi:hypothetical protein